MKLSPCYHFSCATAKFSVLLARFLKGLSMFFISCATSLILSRNTPISILSSHSTETTLPVTAHGSLVSSFKTRCQVRSLLWLEASSVCPSFWEQTHARAMQYQGLCDPPLARSVLCLPWNSFPTSLSSCAFLQPYQPLCCFWKHTKRISLKTCICTCCCLVLEWLRSTSVTSSERLFLTTVYPIAASSHHFLDSVSCLY